MDPGRKIIIPLIAIFVVIGGSLTASKNLLANRGIDHNVLIVANLLFFLINLAAFFMQKKALNNSNPNVFVRSVMAGMLIKMVVCITAVILYRLFAGNSVSKVSVFSAMFLYFVYLGVEVAAITKLNKQKHA